MTDSNTQIDALIARIAHRFAKSGIAYGQGAPDALAEAEMLVYGFARRHPDLDAATLDDLARRRITQRIPAQHLTGEAYFGGLWFAVASGLMIPRSPIAELLDARMQPWIQAAPRRVLDLCCGTGCLGICAALAFPDAEVVLVDCDDRALACATVNAERHGVRERVRVIRSDLLDAVHAPDTSLFDLVIANPPYVPEAEVEAAEPEFHREPLLGLAAGSDGLTIWRRILAGLPRVISPAGTLVGECGTVAAAFAAEFASIEPVWPEITHAQRMDDGPFGVFVADAVHLVR